MQFTALILALAGASAAATTASQPQCAPEVVALASGIHLNILGQHAELNATKNLQAIESRLEFPLDLLAFQEGKGELLALIATGITIRKFNQGVAPKNNKANPGLAKYASAQLTEQGLAQGLNGQQAHDLPVLATLVGDISNGTKLNERNLAAATEGCSLGFAFPASS